MRSRQFFASWPLALVALLAVTTAKTSHAASENLRLAYEPGDAESLCPPEPALREAVLSHLGYDPFVGPSDRGVRDEVSLRIERAPRGLVARIDRKSGARTSGHKELTAAESACADLVSAAAFAIAFAIDPLHARPPPPAAAPPRSPSLSLSPPPSLSPAAEHTARAPSRPTPPARLRLGLGALGVVGAEPSATVAANALVGVAYEQWSLDLEGRADAPASQRLSSGESISASILAGSLVPCVGYRALRACAVGSLGVLRSSSEGFAVGAQTQGLWAATGARAGAELALSDVVRVRAFGELVAQLTRTSLVADARTVWTSHPLAFAVGVGAVVELR